MNVLNRHFLVSQVPSAHACPVGICLCDCRILSLGFRATPDDAILGHTDAEDRGSRPRLPQEGATVHRGRRQERHSNGGRS